MIAIHQKSRGFTLIEMIVSLMIFSIVAVVALAALVRIMDANNKSQTIQDAVVNMSFTMESMTRELRTGSTYYCQYPVGSSGMTVPTLSSRSVSACSGGVNGSSGNGVVFAFLSNRTAPQGSNTCRLINAYEIIPNSPSTGTFVFKKAQQTSCSQNLNGSDFTPVIDQTSMSITDYYLSVTDVEFPLLFIKLDGNAGGREAVKTYFSLQTAASPRIP